MPSGFHYREDFITGGDELVLLHAIADVVFSEFEMRGVVARRRVAFFGHSYDRAAAGPIPPFLLPLRARIGHWAGVDSEAFAMALINEYRPGTADRLASGRTPSTASWGECPSCRDAA